MRGITIAAIAAAAVVGIVAAMLLMFIPASRGASEDGTPQAQNSTQPIPVAEDSSYRKLNVTVNGISLIADVAETGEQRRKGLSIKDQLNENESMLFVFSKPGEHSFWMKGMKFPIDIIWLDSDRKVIHVERELEPCITDACPQYMPGEDALYVLETAAGFADMNGLREGTLVDFDPALLD